MSIDSQLQNAVKELERDIQKELEVVARETFYTAQGLVPVKSGQLKDSGSYFVRTSNFSIDYSAPYAANVYDPLENPREKVTVPYVMDIKRDFKRRTPSGKIVRVRKHKKKFSTLAERPVKVDNNNWRVVNVNETNQKLNKWIEDAWSIVYSKMDSEDKEIFDANAQIR
tara:strand:+ start:174 stop:680 length:507 start_codon:yes stop_codon:yes gene_type:complete